MAVAAVAPLAAQDPTADLPTDWTWRLDAPQELASGDEVRPGEWRYATMAPGWHVTTTEEGALFFPKDRTVTGRFSVEVELFLFPEPGDAPLGIVLEQPGRAGAEARQLRFLLNGEGEAGLHSTDGPTETAVVPLRPDTAVDPHDGGVRKYVLRVEHESGALRFTVDGAEVLSYPVNASSRPLIPGLRVGPGLDVHVSRFDLVTPLAPPRPRVPTGAAGRPFP